jgi:hypothetical protein
MPGALAAENPRALAWLALDGFGLIPTLTVVRGIEMADRGLSISAPMLYALAVGSIVFGAMWLLGTNVLCARGDASQYAQRARDFYRRNVLELSRVTAGALSFCDTCEFQIHHCLHQFFFAENLAPQAIILVVAFLLDARRE